MAIVKVRTRNELVQLNAAPKQGPAGSQNVAPSFPCKVCMLQFNSQFDLAAHYASQEHSAKLQVKLNVWVIFAMPLLSIHKP